MKTFACASCFVLAGYFIAAHFSTAIAADTNPPPRLTVELRDGSRVVGTSVGKFFKFHSALLGEIKLDVKDIRSVECVSSNSVKLTAANGDTLMVAFADSKITVTTSFGKVDLQADSLRKISVVAGGSGGQPSGLVALWSGEGNANDSVGGCNGRLVNGVGFMPGKVGQAFDLNENFNGINNGFGGGYGGGLQGGRFYRGGGYVLIPASQTLDVGKGDGFTIAAWINPTTTATSMLIAEYERTLGTYNGSDVGLQFGINAQPSSGTGAGCLVANIKDVGDGDHIFASPPNLVVAGIWQHIALSYDNASGAAVFYLNGVEVGRSNLGSFTPQTSFANLLLGARTTFNSTSNPSDRFSGGMDEIAIYNRALSAAEIRDKYDAEK